MEGAATIVVLLIVAGFAVFSGLGMMWGAGAAKGEKREGGGPNIGKIVTVIVIGIFIAMWLGTPGTGDQIADLINSMWRNVIKGVQPLIAIATQLAIVAGVIYLFVLYMRRHRRK